MVLSCLFTNSCLSLCQVIPEQLLRSFPVAVKMERLGGTSPWGRNTWKSNCEQEVAEPCFAWCTVLGTMWLPRQICASDLHLQGPLLWLVQPHTEHSLAWEELLHCQTCTNAVPDFGEMPSPCARGPGSHW